MEGTWCLTHPDQAAVGEGITQRFSWGMPILSLPDTD